MSNEPKHTWTVEAPVMGYSDWYVYDPESHRGICKTALECDARLIAAAPDLLEALRMALDQLEEWDKYAHSDSRVAENSFEVCGILRAAIAKATNGGE